MKYCHPKLASAGVITSDVGRRQQRAPAKFAAATAGPVSHARGATSGRNEKKKGDGMVIGFGCRDRDWMRKVSGNLGSSATNQNFEIILKFNFSEQFIRVNFRDVTNLPHLK